MGVFVGGSTTTVKTYFTSGSMSQGDDRSWAISYWTFVPSGTVADRGVGISFSRDTMTSEFIASYLEEGGPAYAFMFGPHNSPALTFFSSNTVKHGWNHYCLVGSGINYRELYLNGVKTANTQSFMYNLVPDLEHATLTGLNSAEGRGEAAEFAVWNSGLRPNQVDALYKGISPLNIAPHNLQLYQPLYDSSYAHDIAGQGVVLYSGASGSQTHPPVFKGGHVQYPKITTAGTCSLYTRGSLGYSSGDYPGPSGETPSWYFNLYTTAHGVSNSGTDLFLKSDAVPYATGLNLTEWGHATFNNLQGAYSSGFSFGFPRTNPLYLTLKTVDALPDPIDSGVPPIPDADPFTMNLYVMGRGSVASGGVDFFTYSTSSPGLYGFTTLAITGLSGSLTASGNMNLYLLNTSVGLGSGNMNLTLLVREIDTYTGSMELSITNTVTTVADSTTLFISTPSGTENYIPASGFMNLYMSRATEAQDGSVGMYVAGPSGSIEFITMFIYGISAQGGINMYTDGVGVYTSAATLYSHGF